MLALTVHAQEGLERLAPFAHGAGRTYAVTARGLDAVGLNPALLAYGTPQAFELEIAPITSFGLNTGSSLSSINNISTIFKSDSAINNGPLLDQFYHNQLSAEIATRVFGLSYYNESIGTIALTWDVHAAFRSVIPDALLDFIHPPQDTGNFVSGRRLDPQYLDVQGVWYNEYGISYGTNFLSGGADRDIDLAGGVTISYVQGVAYLRVDPNSFISFNYPNAPGGAASIQTQYSVQFASPAAFNGNLPTGVLNIISGATAGTGIGMSAGLVASENPSAGKLPQWRCGLSITDIGSIRWTSHTDVRRQTAADVAIPFDKAGSFSPDSLSSYSHQLGGTLDTIDAPFTSSLPTTLHVAGMLDLAIIGITIPHSSLSVASEFAYGFADVVSSPNKGRFGLAAIFDRPSTAVAFHSALGMATQEGATTLTFAIGAGILNTFFLDFGTSNLTGLWSPTGRPDLAAGMKILF